jgi:hypothetical protein
MKKQIRFELEVFTEKLGFINRHYSEEIDLFLKWLATVITIAGALAVSFHWDPLNIYLLNSACIVWIAWGWRIREWSIVTVNVSLLAIYLHGLGMRIL